MPVNIDITASSMTGLLGAVAASKANASRRKAADTADEYNLSRFSKGSRISKTSSQPKNAIERHHRGANKGIKQRAAKDERDHLRMRTTQLAPSVAEQLAMDSLERKAKIYEATINGRAGGLSDKQLEGCTLDIEAKRAQQQQTNLVVISDSEEDEPQASSSQMPPLAFTGRLNSDRERDQSLGAVKVMDEEEWIETQDEFGRTVLLPASDVPSVTSDPQKTMTFVQTESANHLTEVQAEYGPQRSFPVLDPSENPRKPTADEPVEKYFDPTAERRQLGTGYYTLSNDPVERQKQQDELRLRGAETENARAAKIPDQAQLSDAERAIEQRKRQIQLKREELARKRLKTNPAVPTSTTSSECVPDAGA